MKGKTVRKAAVCLILALLCASLLAGCGKPAKWSREGYFTDENDNMLVIFPSEDEEHPGWSVSLFAGEEIHGWYIEQEGKNLHGNLVGEYEDGGEFIVTVSEEGKDGVKVEVDGGDTYHFLPYEMPEVKVHATINVEGDGCIAYAEGEQDPEVDEEYPFQSAVLNLPEEETYTILAYPQPGWKFVKWTKNGEDLSAEAKIVEHLTGDAEYIAVFDIDEDYVDPLEVYCGSYSAGRPSADVSTFDGNISVTIHWANSASEGVQWDFIGEMDEETGVVNYEYGSKRTVVYDSDGGITDEERVYEDGTGTITFAPDGSSFTWHDGMEEREDLVFERVPEAEE